MNTQTLLDELAHNLGPDNVRAEGEHAFLLPFTWTARPLAILSPGSSADIVFIVKSAQAAGISLIPVGGVTQLGTGYPPPDDRPYLVVETQRLDRVLDYQPDDLTVTVEPGLSLSRLQERLSEQHQMLAIDTPLAKSATLGGLVSTNTTGFWRAAYGAPRDLLIGLQAVMSEGVVIKGGGRVVKNVAGYDVCKLFTGAWGTVGILSELTFKVRPQPERRRTLAWKTPDLATAARIGLSLHHARLAVNYVLASNEWKEGPALIVGIEGTAARVNWQAEELARRVAQEGVTATQEELQPDEEAILRDRQTRLELSKPVAVRIACLPTEIEALVAALAPLPDLSITANCGAGTLNIDFPSADPGAIQDLRSKLPRTANTTWIKLAIDRESARDIPVWGETREDFLLHRTLKQALDPQSTFSPGRFYGRL